jgi:hypothetical protein
MSGQIKDSVGNGGVQEKLYLPHVHDFRGFAITLIIATHCLSLFDWSAHPTLELFLKRLITNGTVIFLFIAGYLFQHLSARYSFGDYISKKTRFVVLPYLFVSIPALILFTRVMERTGMPQGFYEQGVIEQAAVFLLTGSHLAPFWFIPTILLFYLASPVLYWLDRQKWFYWLMPVLLLIPFFISRGSMNPLKSFVHFFPVWVLGMACSHYKELSTRWMGKTFWMLFLLFVILFGLEIIFAKGTHSWYSSFGKIILTLFLFELFRRWGRGSRPWFHLAGTLSFGLFFVHSYVISAAKVGMERVFGGLPVGGLMFYLVSIPIAVLLSMLVVKISMRIFGSHSRSFVGV